MKQIFEEVVQSSGAYQKRKLLEHVLRTDNEDPLRYVTYEPNTAKMVFQGSKQNRKTLTLLRVRGNETHSENIEIQHPRSNLGTL